jgi:ferritin-like protein
MEKNKSGLLRSIYLYTFSAVGLILIIIGSVNIIDILLKATIFKQADVYYSYPYAYQPIKGGEEQISKEEREKIMEEERKAQEMNSKNERARKLSNSIAMIIVGSPLFIYHWKILRKPEET